MINVTDIPNQLVQDAIAAIKNACTYSADYAFINDTRKKLESALADATAQQLVLDDSGKTLSDTLLENKIRPSAEWDRQNDILSAERSISVGPPSTAELLAENENLKQRARITANVANCGTADSFLALSDENKRIWFASAVETSSELKRAQVEIIHLQQTIDAFEQSSGSDLPEYSMAQDDVGTSLVAFLRSDQEPTSLQALLEFKNNLEQASATV